MEENPTGHTTMPPNSASIAPSNPTSFTSTSPTSPTPLSPQPKKRSKTGLIIGLLLILLAGGGTALAFAFDVFSPNPNQLISSAINKLFSANSPQRIVASGTIEFTAKSDDSPIKSLRLSINAQADQPQKSHASTIDINTNIADFGDLSLKIEESFITGKTLYLKLNHLIESLENSKLSSTLKEIKASSPDIYATIEKLDGQWVSVALDNSKDNLVKNLLPLPKADFDCLADAEKDLKSELGQLFSAHNFLDSAKSIKNKSLLEVSVNPNQLANFAQAVANSTSIKNRLEKCHDEPIKNAPLDDSDKQQIIEFAKKLPKLHLAIDKNHNITKLAFSTDLADSTTTIDLNFSYPKTTNITKPENAIPLEDIIIKPLKDLGLH